MHQARGLVHARLGEYPQALQAYSQALALERRADTLRYRGRVYLAVQDATLALADFEAALGLAPGDGEALCGRAMARVLLGQIESSRNYLNAYVTILLQKEPLTVAACSSYFLATQIRYALGDAEAAVKQARPTPTLLFDAACVYARAAQHDVPLNPRDVPRHQERAVALLRAALEAVPPTDRAAFWRRHVQAEPALLTLRQTEGMRQLARTYAR